MADEQIHDPLNFMRNLWGNMGFSLPGMVTPTFDLDELDKRIKDMKAVEGWLRMNLSMLQMTIQNLEMQRSTVSAVQAMGQMASRASQAMSGDHQEQEAAAAPSVSEMALWPWQMMQQMQEHLQQATASVAAAASAPEKPAAAKKPAARPAARKAAAKPAAKPAARATKK
ncbi:MAG: hypothetical protein LBE62_08220 [Azonexus sp.]|nr:hypothetical protein [Azonexus sp.]